MGEKFVNYQIRSNSLLDVVQEIKYITRTKAYVSLPKNGWITVYDQMSDCELKYDEIYHFAQELSFKLSSIIFTFVVFSGLHFIYFLHDHGKLLDEFYDDPEAFEFGFYYADATILEKFRGKPETLLRYCLPDVDLQAVAHILTSSRERDLEYMGQDAAYEFALLLGIDQDRAISGYRYFENDSLYDEVDPVMKDAKDFLLVQRLAE